MGLFARMSGLNKLVDHYPTSHEPGESVHKQTVKIGIVRYRKCVTLNCGPEGLFLWIRQPLSRTRKILIPWEEIKGIRAGRLYGRQGARMMIGEPRIGEITVYEELFERMRENLKGMGLA